MSLVQVNLLHIFVIAPLLIYTGYNKDDTHQFIKYSVGSLVFLIPFIVSIPDLSKLNIMYHLNNFLHWTVIMLYFGYLSYLFIYKQSNPINNNIYISMIVIGIIVLIVHMYKLYQKYMYKKNSEKERIQMNNINQNL